MATSVYTGKEWLRICPKDNHQIEASKNAGPYWFQRGCRQNFEFRDLYEKNGEIFAMTSQGLYSSKHESLSPAGGCRNAGSDS